MIDLDLIKARLNAAEQDKWFLTNADNEFIANARNDVASLVKEVEGLRELLEELQGLIDVKS